MSHFESENYPSLDNSEDLRTYLNKVRACKQKDQSIVEQINETLSTHGEFITIDEWHSSTGENSNNANEVDIKLCADGEHKNEGTNEVKDDVKEDLIHNLKSDVNDKVKDNVEENVKYYFKENIKDNTENVKDGSTTDQSDGPSKQELGDNLNPKWPVLMKMFENDNHAILKYRWKTSTIANPKRNLTALSYASSMPGHRLQSAIALDSMSEEADAEDLPEGDEPPAKRPRSENCTFVMERVLEDLDKRLSVLRTAVVGKAAVSLLEAKPKPSMKMIRRTKKYKEMIEKRETHKAISNVRLQEALRGMEAQIKRLSNARQDVLHFHSFYDQTSLNEHEMDELLSTESVLATYRETYANN